MVPQSTLAAAVHAAGEACFDAQRACDDAELVGRLATAARERSWMNRNGPAVGRDERARPKLLLDPGRLSPLRFPSR